jgi:hypothetical protein
MRERGLRQARRFSWRETAERTLAAYRDAAAGTATYSPTKSAKDAKS